MFEHFKIKTFISFSSWSKSGNSCGNNCLCGRSSTHNSPTASIVPTEHRLILETMFKWKHFCPISTSLYPIKVNWIKGEVVKSSLLFMVMKTYHNLFCQIHPEYLYSFIEHLLMAYLVIGTLLGNGYMEIKAAILLLASKHFNIQVKYINKGIQRGQKENPQKLFEWGGCQSKGSQRRLWVTQI